MGSKRQESMMVMQAADDDSDYTDMERLSMAGSEMNRFSVMSGDTDFARGSISTDLNRLTVNTQVNRLSVVTELEKIEED